MKRRKLKTNRPHKPSSDALSSSKDFRWTPSLVEEQAKIVLEIAKKSLNGERIKAVDWHRNTLVTERARARDPRPPGPATYDVERKTSMGSPKKLSSTMGKPRGSATVRRLPGSDRIRVLPVEKPVDMRRGRQKKADEEHVPDDVALGRLSTVRRAPAWSLQGRTEEPNFKVDVPYAQGITTTFGRQVLSTQKSTASAVVTSLPKPDRTFVDRASMPGPNAYGELRRPGEKRAPRTVLGGKARPPLEDRSKSLQPGPGHYRVPDSLKAADIDSKYTSAKTRTFGPPLAAAPLSVDPPEGERAAQLLADALRRERYSAAHDRKQPMVLREKEQ